MVRVAETDNDHYLYRHMISSSTASTTMAKKKLSVLDVLDNDPMNLLSNPDEDGEYEAEQSGHISVNGEDDKESDEDDEREDEEDEEEVIIMMPSPPTTTSKKHGKRKHDNEGKSLSIASSGSRIHCICHTDTDNAPIIKKINYILSITTAIEMKKPVSRRTTKSQSLQLSSDNEWDTVKAQILQKISVSSPSKAVDFNNYNFMFHIPRVVSKPGAPLTNAPEYAFMIENAIKAKTPMVNLNIIENTQAGESDKENESDEGEGPGGKSKKNGTKVRICSTFPPPS